MEILNLNQEYSTWQPNYFVNTMGGVYQGGTTYGWYPGGLENQAGYQNHSGGLYGNIFPFINTAMYPTGFTAGTIGVPSPIVSNSCRTPKELLEARLVNEPGLLKKKIDLEDISLYFTNEGMLYVLNKNSGAKYFKALIEIVLPNIEYKIVGKDMAIINGVYSFERATQENILGRLQNIQKNYIIRSLRIERDFLATNLGLIYIGTDYLIPKVQILGVSLSLKTTLGQPIQQDLFRALADEKYLFLAGDTGEVIPKEMVANLKILEGYKKEIKNYE